MLDPRFDPLPVNPVAYPHRLAHDLSWGGHHEKWANSFPVHVDQYGPWKFAQLNLSPYAMLSDYLDKVWGNKLINIKLLYQYEYLVILRNLGDGVVEYELTAKALQLPEQRSSASVFISYARRESSALALLIVARFKEHGRVPYLDMNPDSDGQQNKLELGGNWQEELDNAIKTRDVMILLVGQSTLFSKHVQREILLAIEHGKNIIPILHNGFDRNNPAHRPPDLPQQIHDVIDNRQGEFVISESPKQYNAAIDSLLMKFMVAP